MDVLTKQWLVAWRLRERPERVPWRWFTAITEGVMQYGLTHHYQTERDLRYFALWSETYPRFSISVLDHRTERPLLYRLECWGIDYGAGTIHETEDFASVPGKLGAWLRKVGLTL